MSLTRNGKILLHVGLVWVSLLILGMWFWIQLEFNQHIVLRVCSVLYAFIIKILEKNNIWHTVSRQKIIFSNQFKCG